MVLIGLTAAGRALLNELDGPVRECHERQLGHLPQTHCANSFALLQAARRPHEEETSSWLPAT